jgi:hypothetical protein
MLSVYIAPWARNSTGAEVRNRPAHCEGINDHQLHNMSTFFCSQHPPGLRTGERALRVRFDTSQ